MINILTSKLKTIIVPLMRSSEVFKKRAFSSCILSPYFWKVFFSLHLCGSLAVGHGKTDADVTLDCQLNSKGSPEPSIGGDIIRQRKDLGKD